MLARLSGTYNRERFYLNGSRRRVFARSEASWRLIEVGPKW